MRLTDDRYAWLLDVRANRPDRIADAAARRARRPPARGPGRTLLLSATQPARGDLAAGADLTALGHRRSLLDRLVLALHHSAVSGVVASPDVLDDLLLLGVLDGKLAFATGRFGPADLPGLVAAGVDGVLLRVGAGDAELDRCSALVSGLAAAGVVALVEPVAAETELLPATTRAAGLGTTSAYTWLAVPPVAYVERLVAATTLPVLLEVADSGAYGHLPWFRALRAPGVRGVLAGRQVLYPAGEEWPQDVYAAVDQVAMLLATAGEVEEVPA
ncbi:MAG: hypothetical protein ACJ73S_08555 [Mycobacteriales bacterium]